MGDSEKRCAEDGTFLALVLLARGRSPIDSQKTPGKMQSMGINYLLAAMKADWGTKSDSKHRTCSRELAAQIQRQARFTQGTDCRNTGNVM